MEGEIKFIWRVADPPCTRFPSPQHRLLTFGIAEKSSTRDGRSFDATHRHWRCSTGPVLRRLRRVHDKTRAVFDAAHRHRGFIDNNALRGWRVLHNDVVGSRGFFHKHGAIPGP